MSFIKKHIIPVIVYFFVAGAVTYMTGQFDWNQLLLSGILFFVFYNIFNKIMTNYKEKKVTEDQKNNHKAVSSSSNSSQYSKKKKKKRSKKKKKK